MPKITDQKNLITGGYYGEKGSINIHLLFCKSYKTTIDTRGMEEGVVLLVLGNKIYTE